MYPKPIRIGIQMDLLNFSGRAIRVSASNISCDPRVWDIKLERAAVLTYARDVLLHMANVFA